MWQSHKYKYKYAHRTHPNTKVGGRQKKKRSKERERARIYLLRRGRRGRASQQKLICLDDGDDGVAYQTTDSTINQ
jgi:hypothetical protein